VLACLSTYRYRVAKSTNAWRAVFLPHHQLGTFKICI